MSTNSSVEVTTAALAIFPFDDLYPFRNIFYMESPNRYKAPSIFFGGTFKQLEDDWSEWFARFRILLSTLDAVEANVILDCVLGRFEWTLMPELLTPDHAGTVDGDSYIGQTWVIVRKPQQTIGLPDLTNVPENLHSDLPFGY